MKVWVTILCVFVCTAAQANGQKIEPINVNLTFAKRALSVAYEVPAVEQSVVEFASTTWAGVRDFHKNVYFVKARNNQGKLLEVDYEPDGVWRVRSNREAFTFSYSIIHQKPTFAVGRSGHNHPTLFDNWAFLWGNSYLLKPSSPRLNRLPVRAVTKPGAYKTAWSSWDESKATRGFDWFADSLLIAGDYRTKQIELDETKVRLAIKGDWKFTDESFAKVVEKIVRAQAKYMRTPPKTDLLIALVPGSPNSNGGSVVGGAIGLYPSPNENLTADGSKSLHLISHEHFHLWIGQILLPQPGPTQEHYKWFHEGCTDYYASLTLYREGLISDSTLIDHFNELLVQFARNPYAKTATAKYMADNFWKDNDINRLPYVKGGLVSLLIDLRIRKATNNEKCIDDFLRELITATRSTKKGYDREMFVRTLGTVVKVEEAEPWDELIERFTVKSEPLPVERVLTSCGLVTETKVIRTFDLGFEVEGGRVEQGSKVVRVSQNSNAAKAGIRVGDTINGMSIYYGDTEKPTALNLERKAIKLDVEYFPTREMEILQIVQSKDNQERLQILKQLSRD